MLDGAFILIAVWLTSPTHEMRLLGMGDVEFVARLKTLDACIKKRDQYRDPNSPDPYNPNLKFICVDLTRD